MTKILFVCRYNRFRSRVAEAYFNKINKNKSYNTKSAGLIEGNPVEGKRDLMIKKKYGLRISGKTRGLSSKLLAWQDLTIIVADDVPEQVFNKNKKYGKRVIVWKIKETNGKKRTPEMVVKEIIKKVDNLVKSLRSKR